MGKVTRLKGDLDDVETLLEIMTVLKDVAANRFFIFIQRKTNYERFLKTFIGFFEMLGEVDTDCPLIKNNHPGVDIVMVTSDLSFMAQMNSRVCSLAMKEYEKYGKTTNIICLGKRAADRCKVLGLNLDRIFSFDEIPDRYEMALQIREYLIERVRGGKTGKVVIVYLWAKTFTLLKPRVVTLLPASELAAEPDEDGKPRKISNKRKDFIPETPVDKIMDGVADIWMHSRLVETINDLQLVEFAATSQQLESAIEGLSGEKKSLGLSLRKASKDELNKAMREVFTSTSMLRR